MSTERESLFAYLDPLVRMFSRGSALPSYRERGDDGVSGKGGRPGVGPSDSQPATKISGSGRVMGVFR